MYAGSGFQLQEYRRQNNDVSSQVFKIGGAVMASPFGATAVSATHGGAGKPHETNRTTLAILFLELSSARQAELFYQNLTYRYQTMLCQLH